MSRIGLLAAATAALIAICGTANAASFRCYGRLTPTESTICHNPELSRLDSQMASLYFQALNNTINAYGPHHRYTNQFRSGQIFWMSSRNGCSANFNCLWTMYMDRVGQLKSDLAQ